jgi:octaprenyl-diphosphate synthase
MKSGVKTREELTIQEVWDLCKEDLLQVEHHIRESLCWEKENFKSDTPYVEAVASHLFNSGGKRFRPLLMILASWLCGDTSRRRIILAGVVEFIHTATLLHDDVIDDAHIRRGKKAPRMIWGNQASILVGDYLYTQALCQALSLKSPEINETLANATRRMAKGELLQLSRNGDVNISEKDYLEIIGYKTAALMAATCRLGAILGNAPEEKQEALQHFGWLMGMSFQLADDTLDYVADSDRLGKSLGKDLQEGKITLPLLHLLRQCKDDDLQQIRDILTSEKRTEKDLALILRLLHQNDSLSYALSLARDYSTQARESLTLFENSPPYQALLTLTDYVVNRDL